MVTIIGAGISGLTLAYFLQKKGIDYQLLEANTEVGGYLQSQKTDKYLFEFGANSILADDEIQNFIAEIGLKDDILMPEKVSQNRYIFKKGKYRALPSKPQHLLWNTFFSWHTKYKIWQETYKKAENIENETLSQFFKRRFSQEIVDYALNPFIAGVYAGNPDELLVKKTFPMLAEFEQKYNSVIRGLIKNKGNARRVSFSFKNGMQQFPKKIASQLKNIILDCKITKINLLTPTNTYILTTTKGNFETDKIVFTNSAFSVIL
jgi:oxygen-dependent protoporphyrinogen oxidase